MLLKDIQPGQMCIVEKLGLPFELERRLERVRQREEEADTGEKKLSAVIWLEGLLEGKEKGEVPREVAAALLEAVIVWADGSLELRFRYASPYPSAP